MGDQRIYIKRASGDIDAKRAAIHCQFMCEEWFGPEKNLTNLGVASLLITFYGYQHYMAVPGAKIDLYSDRAAFCGLQYNELLSDKTLYRENLRGYMEPHVIPDNDLDKAASKKPTELEEATITQPADGVEVCCIYHPYDAAISAFILPLGKARLKPKMLHYYYNLKQSKYLVKMLGLATWVLLR
jgi:hypothetical protein